MMDDATRRELAALADGTLRRADALRRAEETPELAEALATQRTARAAIRATTSDPAPAALRATVAAMVAAAPAEPPASRRSLPRGIFPHGRFLSDGLVPRRRFLPRGLVPRRTLALAGVAAALLAAGVLATVPSSPSVAEAAQLALAPARAAAPSPRADGTLAASVDGVAYPYWEHWRATGARRDVVRGRPIRTVFYDDGRRRIGYAIAAGAPLSVHGGATVERDGVRLRVLRAGAATIVTWLRDGHTCILAARGVDANVLLRLATWRA